jgi:serine/threonine-protein kinase
VKPQNVLIDDAGDAKVADFGIALAASTSTTSGTNRVFGTASYMSPEQAMGERVGPESDLYSLGVVLYEMLLATALPLRSSRFLILANASSMGL